MDHENLPCDVPSLGMCASDRDIFDQVWKRVMPEERADCPIAVVPREAAQPPVHTPSAPPEPVPVPEPVPAPETAPAPEPVPAPETAPVPETVPVPEPAPAPEQDTPEILDSAAPTGDDFPGQDAVPCLGSGSAGHGNQLQEDVMTELEGWQLYRHLARRVTGSASRTLSALASEKHRQARRLAAAYFLISGVRYWPTDRLPAPRTVSWLGTLRRRFTLEQRLESRYRAAALDTGDPCLAELYRELAEGCAAQAGALRSLLESAL